MHHDDAGAPEPAAAGGSDRDAGDALRDAGRWREAADTYARHLAAAPDDWPILVQLGHCTKEMGFPAAALGHYRRAEALAPNDADLQKQIGHTLGLLGERAAALGAYARALGLDPDDAEARRLVASAWADDAADRPPGPPRPAGLAASPRGDAAGARPGRSDVEQAFRYLLGRDPGDGDAVERYAALPDWRALREVLLRSAEFGRAWRPAAAAATPRWVVAPVHGGRWWMWVDLADAYVSGGCLADRYEPAETAFVEACLRRGDVAVDAGANLGWHTLAMAGAVGPTGRVHAFEPRPGTADRLSGTLALNCLRLDAADARPAGSAAWATAARDFDPVPDWWMRRAEPPWAEPPWAAPRVVHHRAALAEESGAATLVWPARTDNPGHSWLAASAAAGEAGAHVEACALDDLGLDRLDLVKLDVEGAEWRALLGARRTLEAHRPALLVEVFPEQLARVSGAAPADVFGWFAARGYAAWFLGPARRGERASGYPAEWPAELASLAFLPEEGVASGRFAPPPRGP